MQITFTMLVFSSSWTQKHSFFVNRDSWTVSFETVQIITNLTIRKTLLEYLLATNIPAHGILGGMNFSQSSEGAGNEEGLGCLH